MDYDVELKKTIQQLSAIFIQNNIPCLPVNLDYLDITIPYDMRITIIKELIIYADELLREYIKEKKKDHYYRKHINHIKRLINDNIDDNYFYGRKKIA